MMGRESNITECNICGKTFRTTQNCKKHLNTVHKDEPMGKKFSNGVVCYICGKTLSSKGNCKTHLEIVHKDYSMGTRFHNKVVCNICGKTFSNGKYRRKHLMSVHRVNVKGEKVPNENTFCNICGKTFVRTEYRKKHFKKVHKIDVNGEKLPDKKFSCVKCGKQYSSKYALQRHIISNHETATFKCDKCDFKTSYVKKLEIHLKENHEVYKFHIFNCSRCKEAFTSVQCLENHVKKCHSTFSSRPVIRFPARSYRRKCPLCSFVSSSKSKAEIHSHLKESHSISCEWKTYSFDSLQEFHKWKSNLQRETTTHYYGYGALKSRYFVCSRSGNFNTRGKNIRSMKKIGTCKINGFCPSTIKLKIEKNGHISAMYLPTHVGHKNELKYIRPQNKPKSKFAKHSPNKTSPDAVAQNLNSLAIIEKNILAFDEDCQENQKIVKQDWLEEVYVDEASIDKKKVYKDFIDPLENDEECKENLKIVNQDWFKEVFVGEDSVDENALEDDDNLEEKTIIIKQERFDKVCGDDDFIDRKTLEDIIGCTVSTIKINSF